MAQALEHNREQTCRAIASYETGYNKALYQGTRKGCPYRPGAGPGVRAPLAGALAGAYTQDAIALANLPGVHRRDPWGNGTGSRRTPGRFESDLRAQPSSMHVRARALKRNLP